MKTTNPEDRAQQIFDEIKAIRATAEERVDAINEAAEEKIAKKLAEIRNPQPQPKRSHHKTKPNKKK